MIAFPGTLCLDEFYALALYAAEELHERITAAGVCNAALADLKQEAMSGLVQARNKFNPAKGVPFAAFARLHIHWALTDYLRELDPLKTAERQKVKKLEQARDELSRCLQREPEVSDLANSLAISEDTVRKWQSLRVVQLSLEGSFQIEPDTDEFAGDWFGSPFDDPEVCLLKDWETQEKAKLAGDVNDCLDSSLDEVERSVLVSRVLAGLTLVQVGQLWNTSKDTVKRRQVEAMDKMRQCLHGKGWQTVDIMQLLP